MAMPTRKLGVKVASAHGLMRSNGQGSPSAFVVLTFDSQQFSTSVKENDPNPVWDESLYFNVSDLSKLPYLVLQACVYNTNTSIQGEKSFLGKVTIYGRSFQPFSPAAFSSAISYPLEKRGMFSPGVRGELGLNVYITDEASIIAQEPNFANSYSAPMGLSVEVVSAHGLMPKDEQGSASTYVELSFDNLRFRTVIKERDLNPVWNERFYFDVWDPSNLPELDINAFVFHVDTSFIDRRRFPNTLLGKVRIAGASCRPLPNAVPMHYPLEKPCMFWRGVRGELSLKVYTIDNLESERKKKSVRPHVSLQDLKEITDNFSDQRIIGQGGFGVVYKGLRQNREMIAVKRIVSSVKPDQEEQFENEVNHLMMLNHPNIVRFVGYCYEIKKEYLEYNGKYIFAAMAEMLLCLEYLPKGSLDKYISDESSGLAWSTRYNIIEGICHGLRHLHEQMDKPILHLDLKPANILLDDGMVPKITDFGLSRLLDQQQTICTSSRDGTFGYMAPEYLLQGIVTPMADIFSLGVIIMEVVTGHRDYPDVTRTPSDDFVELTLEKWRNVLQRSTGDPSENTANK